MLGSAPLRVVFMGTPPFAAAALRALIQAGFDIVAAYTQPPKPAGRGGKITKSAVHLLAEELKIPVLTPKTLKKPETQAEFAALSPDVAVVAAYGLILPQAILDIPRYGCLNIHASLLPRWRGAAPIQRALLAGDRETGITLMQMDAGLDTGGMIAKRTIAIDQHTTAATLHDALAATGAEIAVEALTTLRTGKSLPATPQDEASASYAKMLSREDGRIDWQQGAPEIERQFRALTPWPGVWCMAGSERLKILGVEILPAADKDSGQEEGKNSATPRPGEILNRDFAVACGQGVLRLISVQPENRKPMDGRSYLNGSVLKPGDCLS